MINYISATRDKIIFKCDGNKLFVKVYSPAICEVVLLGEYELDVNNGIAELPRFATNRDGAYLKYVDENNNIKYVSHIESKFAEDYPKQKTKKGLQVECIEDAKNLGAKYSTLNVAISDYFMPKGTPNTEEYVFDGETYYINKHIQEINDKHIKNFTDAGIVVTLIMICGTNWRVPITDEMRPIILHPKYNSRGILSAFNVETDIGIRHFQAFCSYFANRYGPDSKYGRIYGSIMSNEVQSQWIWGNCGEMTCEEFANEYTTVMRIAQLSGENVFSSYRTYISLDHFWKGIVREEEPLHFYSGKGLLNEIVNRCNKEGNFAWNIAHHPYPENLTKPDFWNDETATSSQDTYRITFKNLEVLAEWVRMPENRFEGNCRHIILSEQGFNSKKDSVSEILQAFAFAKAYKKVMEIPEIDEFIYYAQFDHYDEYGLRLGMWRKFDDDRFRWKYTGKKPLYDLFKVIDTIDDTGRFVWERYC